MPEEKTQPEKAQTGIKLDLELIKFLKSQAPLHGLNYGSYVNQILWEKMENVIPELKVAREKRQIEPSPDIS